MSGRVLHRRIAAALGETVETVERMEEDERRQVMATLGLGGTKLAVYEQIAAMTGETVEAVISLQEQERNQLIQVLGLGQQQTLQIGDDSGDDVILIKSPKRDSITISDDEMPLATSSPRREFGSGGGVEEGDEGDEGEEGSELLPLHKLELHAMACQGLHLNGGEGLEVNPMEVQSRCGMCSCLVPDLVMEEHRETCWANNRAKRRIETPMERRKSKFPKTSHWSSAPRR